MSSQEIASRRRKHRRSRAATKQQRDRRGAITVLTAVLIILLMAMLAFAIDTGYMTNTHTELKRAVDAGALAGAGALVHGQSQAKRQAYDFVSRNLVATEALPENDVEVYLGEWDIATRTFRESNSQPNAVRVVAMRKDAPLFFGKVLGHDDFDMTEEAIATYQPRDIVVVLDYSASMNDDSEFRHMSRLGRRSPNGSFDNAAKWHTASTPSKSATATSRRSLRMQGTSSPKPPSVQPSK